MGQFHLTFKKKKWCGKSKSKNKKRVAFFLLFFSSLKGQHIHSISSSLGIDLSLLFLSRSLSLSLPSSRTKSAREKFSEITQPSLPPSGGSFDVRTFRERERERERRE